MQLGDFIRVTDTKDGQAYEGCVVFYDERNTRIDTLGDPKQPWSGLTWTTGDTSYTIEYPRQPEGSIPDLEVLKKIVDERMDVLAHTWSIVRAKDLHAENLDDAIYQILIVELALKAVNEASRALDDATLRARNKR